jgi:hypothetical protein
MVMEVTSLPKIKMMEDRRIFNKRNLNKIIIINKIQKRKKIYQCPKQ